MADPYELLIQPYECTKSLLHWVAIRINVMDLAQVQFTNSFFDPGKIPDHHPKQLIHADQTACSQRNFRQPEIS